MVMEKEVADSTDSPLEGIFSSSASLYSNLLPGSNFLSNRVHIKLEWCSQGAVLGVLLKSEL